MPKTTQQKLDPGTRLVHRRHGKVIARATVGDDGAIKYAGKAFPSLSAAGSAAAKRLKMHASVNGRTFWRLASIAALLIAATVGATGCGSTAPTPPIAGAITCDGGACDGAFTDYGLNVVDTTHDGVELTFVLPFASAGYALDLPLAEIAAVATTADGEVCNLSGPATWLRSDAGWSLAVSLTCPASSGHGAGSLIGRSFCATYLGSAVQK